MGLQRSADNGLASGACDEPEAPRRSTRDWLKRGPTLALSGLLVLPIIGPERLSCNSLLVLFLALAALTADFANGSILSFLLAPLFDSCYGIDL